MALVQRMLFWQRWASATVTPEREARTERVRALIDHHADTIYRTARRLGVAERDVDDVAQDVLLVLVRRVSDIEADKAHAFVVGTTIRVIANLRRRWRRRAEDLTDDMDGSIPPGASAAPVEQRLEQARLLEILQQALDQMTEAQRVTFVLFELEECTAKETAQALGVSEATVVSRVRRAREVVWTVREHYAELDARGNQRGHGGNR